MLKKQIRTWFRVALSTLTLAIALLISPSVSLAQRDLIPMARSGEDIQPLFDLVGYPYRDLAPFRLQNSAEREAYERLRTILQTGTTILSAKRITMAPIV